MCTLFLYLGKSIENNILMIKNILKSILRSSLLKKSQEEKSQEVLLQQLP